MNINFPPINYNLKDDMQPSNKAVQTNYEIQAPTVSSLEAMKNYNIGFMGSQKNNVCQKSPVYAIYKDGSYQKFDSQAAAACKLNIMRTDISRCVCKKIESIEDYNFVRADEIEKEENGETIVDEELLKNSTPKENTEYKSVQKPQKSKKKVQPAQKEIYAVDIYGKYKKFKNAGEAAEALELDKSTVVQCISGHQKKAGIYTFVPAEKIEIKKEDGRSVVNYLKIQKALENFRNKPKKS